MTPGSFGSFQWWCRFFAVFICGRFIVPVGAIGGSCGMALSGAVGWRVRGSVCVCVCVCVCVYGWGVVHCAQSRELRARTSPSKVYPAGKPQWHFTCGFHFRHSVWLPFVTAFAVLKGLIAKSRFRNFT